MGAFYTNITLDRVDKRSVIEALAGRKGYLYWRDRQAVVFDAETEDQDMNVLGSLALSLSQSLSCAALAALNHDDDILRLQLYHEGKLLDDYDSTPGYWEDGDEERPPTGGDAGLLCSILGSGSFDWVEEILRESSEAERFLFATDRHRELTKALGLPLCSVGFGFSYLSQGDIPDDIEESDLVRLGT